MNTCVLPRASGGFLSGRESCLQLRDPLSEPLGFTSISPHPHPATLAEALPWSLWPPDASMHFQMSRVARRHTHSPLAPHPHPVIQAILPLQVQLGMVGEGEGSFRDYTWLAVVPTKDNNSLRPWSICLALCVFEEDLWKNKTHSTRLLLPFLGPLLLVVKLNDFYFSCRACLRREDKISF